MSRPWTGCDRYRRSACRRALGRRHARQPRDRSYDRRLDREFLRRRPRSTIDIDIVAAIEERDILSLVEALAQAFYVGDEALRRAVRMRSSANLIHLDTMLKVDLFVAGGTPLDSQQLARRQAVVVRPGVTLYVHPPEDILLQKLRWLRLGGDWSDRQWRDALGIVRVQGARLDRDYLRLNAPVLAVTDLLNRLLDDAV